MCLGPGEPGQSVLAGKQIAQEEPEKGITGACGIYDVFHGVCSDAGCSHSS